VEAILQTIQNQQKLKKLMKDADILLDARHKSIGIGRIIIGV
jgi:hypothetical protein